MPYKKKERFTWDAPPANRVELQYHRCLNLNSISTTEPNEDFIKTVKFNFETFQRVFGEALNMDEENERVPRNLNN
ncbi:hypothetical protein MTR_8g077210 [Medicago truncatula]|uniref:Uncharacterized protein n=1 Tax=Medicago truncatula TaxID=3880 RepID=A0A072TTE7_MEDTR|nr:hypothetical protein MTR_8g077210 [Medicago truncatula]